MPDTVFTAGELEYLNGERRLARIATVGPDGTPHVVPVGMWKHNAELDTVDVTGRDFDKKTGLLKRYIRYANTMVGRIPTQVDYDDYRDVAGVKIPFKFSYAWVSERDDWTFTTYDANPAIDNAKFGRPDPKTAGDVQGRTAK